MPHLVRTLPLLALGLVAAGPVRAQSVLGVADALAPDVVELAEVPGDVLMLDFTGDALPDALVADRQAGLLLLRASPPGGLLAPETLPLPPDVQPLRMRAGDLDADGVLDLVLSPTVLFTPLIAALGDGQGGFGNAHAVSSNVGLLNGFVLADLGADGALDLATSESSLISAVKVRTGDGLGGFGPEQQLPGWGMATTAGDLETMEVTGDAWLDLVVSAGSPGLGFKGVRVFAGTGGGAFGSSTPLLDASDQGLLAVTDLDADDRDDLVVTRPEAVRVHYQAAPGVLGPAVITDFGAPLPSAPGPALVLGALDGDGVPDAVALAPSGLLQLHGTATEGFHAGPPLAFIGSGSLAAIADVDRDGQVDALLGRSLAFSPAFGGLLEVVRGDGAGFLGPVPAPPPLDKLQSLATGDFDGDGLPDLASDALSDDGVALFRNLTGGQFAPAVVVSAPELGLLADLDADGSTDMVTATQPLLDSVAVRLASGFGFAPPVSFPAGPKPLPVAIADVNDDGHLDVIATSGGLAGSLVRMLPGDGAGSFGAPVFSADTGFVLPVTVLDANLDGHLDLGTCFSNEVALLVGDGTGLFSIGPHKLVPGVGTLGDITAGDVDGDGDADLVAVAATSVAGTLVVVPSIGPSLGAPLEQPVTQFGGDFELADMDGDGALDAVSAGAGDGLVVVQRGDGHGAFPTKRLHHVLPDTLLPVKAAVAVLDADGDGRLDVAALRNGSDPALGLRLSSPTPWANLGFALAGTGPAPKLGGVGALLPHSAGVLDLAGAPPNGVTSLFFGLEAAWMPFHGGTLVPAGLTRFVFPTSPGGGLQLAWLDFPALPPGLELYAQCWSADAAAPQGLSASNAVRATVP